MRKFKLEIYLLITGFILFGFIAPALTSVAVTELNILGVSLVVLFILTGVYLLEEKYKKKDDKNENEKL